MTQDRPTRWPGRLTLVAAAIALGVVLVYYSIAKSDAFDVTSSFLRGQAEVVRSVGRVEDASLSFWSGGKIWSSGDRGSGSFTVNIRGASGSTQAYVELKRRGSWEVQFARLLPSSGEPIVLRDIH
jgi:hypothetical protein